MQGMESRIGVTPQLGSRLSATLTASHRNLHRQNKPKILTVM